MMFRGHKGIRWSQSCTQTPLGAVLPLQGVGDSAAQAPLHGRIMAASLGTGDAVAFPFTLSRSGVALRASPGDPAAASQRTRRREGTAQQGFRGQLALASDGCWHTHLQLHGPKALYFV